MTVLVSDQFTGGDVADIVGRTTDSGLGGSAKTWEKGAGSRAVAISGGAAVHGASAGTANVYAFDAGSGDVLVTMKLNSLTTSSQSLVLIARQATSLATQTYYSALLNVASNVLRLRKVVAGTPTQLGTDQTWANGDTIGVQCIGTTIELWKNGSTLISVTDSAIPNTNTKCGVRPTATATFSIDDFLVQGAVLASSTGFFALL